LTKKVIGDERWDSTYTSPTINSYLQFIRDKLSSIVKQDSVHSTFYFIYLI